MVIEKQNKMNIDDKRCSIKYDDRKKWIKKHSMKCYDKKKLKWIEIRNENIVRNMKHDERKSFWSVWKNLTNLNEIDCMCIFN